MGLHSFSSSSFIPEDIVHRQDSTSKALVTLLRGLPEPRRLCVKSKGEERSVMSTDLKESF